MNDQIDINHQINDDINIVGKGNITWIFGEQRITCLCDIRYKNNLCGYFRIDRYKPPRAGASDTKEITFVRVNCGVDSTNVDKFTEAPISFDTQYLSKHNLSEMIQAVEGPINSMVEWSKRNRNYE